MFKSFWSLSSVKSDVTFRLVEEAFWNGCEEVMYHIKVKMVVDQNSETVNFAYPGQYSYNTKMTNFELKNFIDAWNAKTAGYCVAACELNWQAVNWHLLNKILSDWKELIGRSPLRADRPGAVCVPKKRWAEQTLFD